MSIARVAILYRQALSAKHDFEDALNTLKKAAENSKAERDIFTKRLNDENPELVKRMRVAYDHGERIKDEMQKGKRWPNHDGKATRYSQIILAVPIDQRSPEILECLKWWQEFEAVLAEIEKLYPAPEHFWWNGFTLAGPNLYKDFGVASNG